MAGDSILIPALSSELPLPPRRLVKELLRSRARVALPHALRDVDLRCTPEPSSGAYGAKPGSSSHACMYGRHQRSSACIEGGQSQSQGDPRTRLHVAHLLLLPLRRAY